MTPKKEREERKEEGATLASDEAARPQRPGYITYDQLRADPEYQKFRANYIKQQELNMAARGFKH